jgi:hypothetical protein
MKTKEEQRQQQQQQLLQPFWHQTFPFKLYEMVEYSSDSEFSSSLSWSADGSTFIIHDKHVLMNDLAPMFFKQTQFSSFVSVPRATCGVLITVLLVVSLLCYISLTPHSLFQTRQLNIWGFVRTDAFGGEKGGWQHEDLLFLRGQPDLLREIERIDMKSAVVKKSPSIISITKARVSSSRSAKRGAKSATTKAVVVTDERSFSSSSRVESRALQSSYNDGRSHVHNTGVGVAAVVSPGLSLSAQKDSGFQYFSSMNFEVQCTNVQDSVSFSSSSSTQGQAVASTITEPQAETMYRYPVDTSSGVVQPFTDDDYLAGIFDREERRSHDDDLCSILSLNQETDAELLNSVFNL